MLVELFVGVLCGVLAGCITGLIPGVHINLVSVFVSFLFPFVPELFFVSFIISLAVSHTFLDIIPAVFLGAPDEDMALSVLPGHQLLLFGHGHFAVLLTLVGSVVSVLFFPFVVLLFWFVVPLVFPFVDRMMGWFLFNISLLLIYFEHGRRLNSLFVFVLAGFLGVASLSISADNVLLPLLGGLFGVSTLFHSVRSATSVPVQSVGKYEFVKSEFVRPTFASLLLAPVFSFFPGLGSSQASIVGSRLFGRLSSRQFLVLVGSVNTLVMLVSFVTISLVGKARTGAASVLLEFSSSVSIGFLFGVVFTTSLLAVPLTVFFSKLFARNVSRFDYVKLSWFIISFLFCITFFFSGFVGVLVLFVSSLVGLTCIELGVRKGLLMGSLLIPTMLLYFPF